MFKVFRGKGRTYSAVIVAERKIGITIVRMKLSFMIDDDIEVWCNSSRWKEGRARQQCTSTPDLLFYHNPSNKYISNFVLYVVLTSSS